MHYSFRLLSFDTSDVRGTSADNQYQKEFSIQMFGVNERGKTACIFVEGYSPFFYVKVDDDWTETKKVGFIAQMTADMGDQFANDIVSSRLIKRKKLYGFDGGRQYNFIHICFRNENAMKKAKGLWYMPFARASASSASASSKSTRYAFCVG